MGTCAGPVRGLCGACTGPVGGLWDALWDALCDALWDALWDDLWDDMWDDLWEEEEELRGFCGRAFGEDLWGPFGAWRTCGGCVRSPSRKGAVSGGGRGRERPVGRSVWMVSEPTP